MVRTGLEKSLKIEKLWDILEKSLNFPQKFLNICESSLYKKKVLKKSVLGKRKDWKHSSKQIFLVIMKVCFMISMFPP